MRYALATALVARDRQKIRFMYREAPDNGEDSGVRATLASAQAFDAPLSAAHSWQRAKFARS